MPEAILDTDILSEVMKRKNQQVLARAQQYLAQYQRLSFSAFTMYEIVRGLFSSKATRQVAEFLKTVSMSNVFPISRPVLMRAAELWAEGHKGGHPHDDADLIIAATALEAQRVLVTGNTNHYSWISGLQLEDWKSPAP